VESWHGEMMSKRKYEIDLLNGSSTCENARGWCSIGMVPSRKMDVLPQVDGAGASNCD